MLRMSVIIELPHGEIICLCKGADDIVLAKSSNYAGKASKESIQSHLETFAAVFY